MAALARTTERELEDVGGHAVRRGHRAQSEDGFIGPRIAHDANGVDRQKDGESLPDGVVEAGGADFFQPDGVGPLEDGDLLRRHLAWDADGKTWPGKRMATDEGGRQTQFSPERANLVLEQLTQRFDELQLHSFRQATDVVVAFDHRRGPAGGGDALDHVRIEGALGQERGALDLGRFASRRHR